ncbi:GREB1-like protein isoform X1 [Petromyzon marinus]|uniref:GREB1-like protein isoform X1 n=1 Tax=Petromyzon marinus TaxID=7757 RepID=UPI003F6F31EC
MGNAYAGQLKSARFEEALHSSIEASLRSGSALPRPVFSQLYLDCEQDPGSPEDVKPTVEELEQELGEGVCGDAGGGRGSMGGRRGGGRRGAAHDEGAGKEGSGSNEENEEGEERLSDSNSPPTLYPPNPPPEGCCTTDGFCQAGKDLRLVSLCADALEVPPGFHLVGAKSPSLPEHVLVCAVDRRFLPDETGKQALLGFSGNCMGCGERGFRYFTEFSNHINLRLTTQPKKQKHLKYFLVRNAQGLLVKGPLIFWNEYRGRLYAAPPPGGGPSTPGPHVATLLPLPAPDEGPGASGGPRLAGTQLGVATERGIGGGGSGGPGSTSASASFLAAPEPFRHHSVLKPSPAFHPQAVALARPSAIAAHYGAYHVSSAIRVNGNGGGGMLGGGPAGPRGAPSGSQLSSTHLRPPSPTGVASAMDNGVSSAGPPKKRHRGWSPGSPSGVGTSGGPPPPVHHSSRTDPALAASALPTPMLGGGVAGAAPLAGESVVVPDSLADVCGTRPVILIGHGTLPYLYGDVGDIVVSPALMSCYGSPQFPPPRAAEALGLAPSAPPLPIETQILLTLHYLAQLGGDRPPFREEFDQILLRTQQQQQQGGPDASHIHSSLGGVIVSGGGAPGPVPPPCISPSQLPWLARLAACPSGGAVRVLATQGSLGEGLAETLGSLARSPRPAAPGRLHGGDGGAATAGAAWGPSVGGSRTTAAARFNRPRYVVVVCTSCARGSEFCVIVTGPLQARAIAENMLSVAECLKEISYELITGKVGILASHFQCSSHERELDWLLDRFEEEREGRVFAPYGDDEGGRLLRADEEAAVALPPAGTVSPPEGFRLHPAQFWVARKLLSQVCAIADAATQHLDLGRFGRVHFLLLIPPSESLYRQTLERLNQSSILADLGVEEGSQKGERYVARLDGDGQAKFEAFLHRVRRNPYTLFVLVHDQAHADTTSGASMSGSHGDVYTGLADRLVNCREAREAANLLTLQVSAAPYGLQSQHSRIAPYNEVYWPLTDPVRQEGPHLLGSEYFGVSEFRREMHSPTRLPAMRHDEAFESLAETLLERFPRLHSAVIRTYLLVRHYAAALLATAGAHGTEAQCTVETRAMLGAVAGPPHATGRGPMLLLRVPSPQLARVAYERLLDVRRRLGMSYRFEVVLAGADGADLTVGKHFLARLRAWRGMEDSDWVPRSFQDLEDLPCILLLSGKDLYGETLPRSLKYCDLRLMSTSGVTRTALEQELGTAARYVTRATASAGKRTPSNEGRRAGAPGEGLRGRTRTASGEEAHSSPHSEGSTMPPTTSSSGVAENGSSPVSSEEGSSLKSTGTGSDPKSPDAPSPDIAAPPPVPPAPPAEGSTSMALRTHPPVPSDPAPEPTTEPSAEVSTQTGGDLKPALVNGGVGLVDERAATSRTSSSPATAAAPSVLHPAPPEPAEVLPPCVLLPKAVAALLRGQGGSELHALLPPAPRVGWATHLRPPPPAHAPAVAAASSAYCRLWTVARQQHCDHDNRAADGGGAGAGGSGGFHPRRLLLCGPPQVGKTGAYLQFLRVLNRMLIRLQEVDVYNEEDINQDLLEGSSSLHVSQDQWPDIEAFRKLTFDPVLRDSRFRNASPVYTPRLGSRVKSGLVERSGGAKRRTVSVTLSKFAAHNTFHHCEQCHLYTDPGPPTQAREAGLHAFTFSSAALGEEVTLHFLVPRSQEHHFVFSASGRTMHSFRLPLITDTEDTVAVRSPIFTPSTGRHEHGLLNLHHALEGAGAAALHVVVVRAGEVPAYQRYWPNHVLLALPRHLDHTGVGLARCLVQELCRENLERERARRAAQVEAAGSAAGGDGAPDAASECTAPGARPQDVWPFVLVMDDSCVMFYEAQPRRRAGATGAETSEGEMEPDGMTREPPACGGGGGSAGGDGAVDTERCVSLRHVLRRLEATPKVTRYAALGVRRWGGSWRAAGPSGAAGTARLHSFSRRHLHDLVLLNVELTRAVTYDHNRYSCEDVDFNLRADGQALLLCCFNAFSVMKKHVGVGGHQHVPVPQAPTAAGVCAPVSPSQFVCAPDSDYTFLQAPAHLLLERYLRVAGSTLFPQAARSHAHPVLALDSYLNLGAQVSVCYASSRAAPVAPPGPFPVYSGLLLYLCDSGLTADMLRRFKFLQGATLCVICQDRSSLRQTVVRLELEEVWQFRLRDEFQTANSPGDRPLFFLTGRHV